jgi:hypothetical protein
VRFRSIFSGWSRRAIAQRQREDNVANPYIDRSAPTPLTNLHDKGKRQAAGSVPRAWKIPNELAKSRWQEPGAARPGGLNVQCLGVCCKEFWTVLLRIRLPLPQNLRRDGDDEVEIEQLAGPAIAVASALANLAIDQPHEPLGGLILGRVGRGNVSVPPELAVGAAKESQQIALGTNLPGAQRFREQEHQAAAAVRQDILPRDQSLVVIDEILHALQCDPRVREDIHQIANDLVAAIDPQCWVFGDDRQSVVLHCGHKRLQPNEDGHPRSPVSVTYWAGVCQRLDVPARSRCGPAAWRDMLVTRLLSMSNPLLRPNDPRFRQPELRDEAGKNRFADEAAVQEGVEALGGDAFAAPGEEARPFDPRFEAQQPPRTGLLFVLGGLGWIGVAFGVLALLGMTETGWICPLLGLGPAAASLLLAREDLKAIRLGAMEERHRPATRLACWIGLIGLVACAAIVGSMIYRQMAFLPDVL